MVGLSYPENLDVDEVLFAASQQYEGSEIATTTVLFDSDPALDELFLAASQQVGELTTVNATTSATSLTVAQSTSFGLPQREKDVEEVKQSRVPKKTQQNTNWAEAVWREWAKHRLTQLSEEETDCGFTLDRDITKMPTLVVNNWLQRIVLEVRKFRGDYYCPDSLHQICCDLQRVLRAANRPEVNFFDNHEFAPFCDVLDGELKRLNGTGKYIHKKKAEVITAEMEEILWQKGLLGEGGPQALVLFSLVSDRVMLRSKEWGGTQTTAPWNTLSRRYLEDKSRWAKAVQANSERSCAPC